MTAFSRKFILFPEIQKGQIRRGCPVQASVLQIRQGDVPNTAGQGHDKRYGKVDQNPVQNRERRPPETVFRFVPDTWNAWLRNCCPGKAAIIITELWMLYGFHGNLPGLFQHFVKILFLRIGFRLIGKSPCLPVLRRMANPDKLFRAAVSGKTTVCVPPYGRRHTNAKPRMAICIFCNGAFEVKRSVQLIGFHRLLRFRKITVIPVFLYLDGCLHHRGTPGGKTGGGTQNDEKQNAVHFPDYFRLHCSFHATPPDIPAKQGKSPRERKKDFFHAMTSGGQYNAGPPPFQALISPLFHDIPAARRSDASEWKNGTFPLRRSNWQSR